MWIKDNEVFITHSDIRRANPDVSMPRNLSDELIAELGYEVVYLTDRPVADVVEELPPAYNAETQRWEQQWSAREFTQQEIEDNLSARRAGMIVTPRQARLALLQAGQLANIDAAIEALDEPTKSAVKIEWEYAVQIERMSPWVQAMTLALGMTDEEVDQLFETAAQI
ncbi:MAG: hypothetical protein RLZZ602_1596 [Pseudomonadota bacterium]|jgi:hypothetical protein